MIDFKIKFAEAMHAKGILEVYSEWQEFKGTLPDKLIETDSLEDILKSINNPESVKKYIVAEDNNGKILGACYIDTSFISLKTIRLGDMMVRSNWRRNGIGESLVDEVVKFAKENDLYKVWLWTQIELKDAIRLYTNKGFIFEGEQKNQFCNKNALLYGLIIKSS